MDDLDKNAQRKYNKWLSKYNSKDAAEYVDIFHRNRKKFEHQDIYRYTFDQLKKEIQDKNIESERRKKYQGSKHVCNFDSKMSVQVIRLDSIDAIRKYFSHTQLCITDALTGKEYLLRGNIFYAVIINSNLFEEKLAIVGDLKTKQIKKRFYNSEDYEHNIDDLPAELISSIEEDLSSLNEANNWYLYSKSKNTQPNKEMFQKTMEHAINQYSISNFKKAINVNFRFIADGTIKCEQSQKRVLIMCLTKSVLKQHLDDKDCQLYFAETCSAKDISLLKLSRKNVLQIIKNRAANDKKIFNKCVKLGVIDAPPKSQKDKYQKLAELKRQIKQLERAINA